MRAVFRIMVAKLELMEYRRGSIVQREVYCGCLRMWRFLRVTYRNGGRGHPELAHEVNDTTRLALPWTLLYNTADYNDGASLWASS
jgi:hypothetical protein